MAVHCETNNVVEHEDGGACPHPVSLETIELIEHALAAMLRSLRPRAGDRAPGEAGAVEYDSWLRLLR